MELLSVQEAVDFLSAATGAHFSVCMWAPPEVPLRFESQVHASPFCAAAKTTARGLDRCLRCKERANRRARAGEPFEGLCAWGVYEFAHPVCVDERVVGVVYAGNLRGAADGARRRAWACARTGVCADRLETLRAAMPELGARAPQLRCAVRWLAEWIALRGADRPKPAPGRVPAPHPAVRLLRQYADRCYMQPLTLHRLARMCHMDEKYLGRLFRQQVGVPFHEFLNHARLEHAAELLRRTADPITGIALDCGFPNVSYFNRRFRAQYGCAPTQYRTQHAGSENNGKAPRTGG